MDNKRGRKKTTLTPEEVKLVSSIPAVKKVTALLAKLGDNRARSTEDRLQLGRELIIVRDKLSVKGRNGLFKKWLTTTGISHARAYVLIGNAGGGTPQKSMKSVKLKLKFLGYFTKFKQARSATAEKRSALLQEFTTWLKAEFDV